MDWGCGTGGQRLSIFYLVLSHSDWPDCLGKEVRPAETFGWAQQSLPSQQSKLLTSTFVHVTCRLPYWHCYNVWDQGHITCLGPDFHIERLRWWCLSEATRLWPANWDLLLAVDISANHRYIWGWHWYQTWHAPRFQSKTSKPGCFSKGRQTISILAIAKHIHLFFRGQSTVSRSFCGDQNQVDIYSCDCGEIGGHQSRYFKPEQDIFLTLNRCFLCQYLTEIATEPEMQSSHISVVCKNVHSQHLFWWSGGCRSTDDGCVVHTKKVIGCTVWSMRSPHVEDYMSERSDVRLYFLIV